MADTTVWIGENIVGHLIEDVPATIGIDEDGVASGSIPYTTAWESAVGLALGMNHHPNYPWLKRKKANITREPGGAAKVVIDFEGLPSNPDPKYSMDGSTSKEPIETHPDFVEKIGGKPGAEKNSAVFDGDGKFKGFKQVHNGSANPKAGVKSYLVPQVTYTQEKYLLATTSLLGSLGKIDTPPSSNVRPSVGSRTWLMIGASASQVGNGIKLKRKWKLSGPRAWDEDIYGDD